MLTTSNRPICKVRGEVVRADIGQGFCNSCFTRVYKYDLYTKYNDGHIYCHKCHAALDHDILRGKHNGGTD